MDEILRMTISTSEPVDLMDFTGSCQAFACEFDRFSKSASDGKPARLLIKEVPHRQHRDRPCAVTANSGRGCV